MSSNCSSETILTLASPSRRHHQSCVCARESQQPPSWRARSRPRFLCEDAIQHPQALQCTRVEVIEWRRTWAKLELGAVLIVDAVHGPAQVREVLDVSESPRSPVARDNSHSSEPCQIGQVARSAPRAGDRSSSMSCPPVRSCEARRSAFPGWLAWQHGNSKAEMARRRTPPRRHSRSLALPTAREGGGTQHAPPVRTGTAHLGMAPGFRLCVCWSWLRSVFSRPAWRFGCACLAFLRAPAWICLPGLTRDFPGRNC